MLVLKVKKYFLKEDVEVKETQSGCRRESRSSHPGDKNIACLGYIDIIRRCSLEKGFTVKSGIGSAKGALPYVFHYCV